MVYIKHTESCRPMSPGVEEMKTILLISLILAAMVSVAMSAETLMTIETNTTIRIDPITGQIKGDAETHVKGIRKVTLRRRTALKHRMQWPPQPIRELPAQRPH